MLTDKTSIPIWSNLPFLLPAFLAFNKGLPLYGLLIIIALTISYFHHSTHISFLKYLDYFFASSVIAANLFVLYLSEFKQPYFGIALVFVVIAFFFFFTGKDEKYDVYHGLWHLCSVVITLCCVIAY